MPLTVCTEPFRTTRSLLQNAKLHAMLGDIAKQKEWAGELLDIDAWKRLLTAGWMRATGQTVKLVPAVDGEGVDVLYRHTHKMSVAEMASLIEYVESWGAEHEIMFSLGHEYDQTMREAG